MAEREEREKKITNESEEQTRNLNENIAKRRESLIQCFQERLRTETEEVRQNLGPILSQEELRRQLGVIEATIQEDQKTELKRLERQHDNAMWSINEYANGLRCSSTDDEFSERKKSRSEFWRWQEEYLNSTSQRVETLKGEYREFMRQLPQCFRSESAELRQKIFQQQPDLQLAEEQYERELQTLAAEFEFMRGIIERDGKEHAACLY